MKTSACNLFCAWVALVGVLASPPLRAQPAQPAQTASPASSAAGPVSAAALPAETFFAHEAISSARLSPSGRWLAVHMAVPGKRVGVAVFDLEAMKLLALTAHFTDADVGNVHWVNDDQLVFEIQDNERGGADQPYWPGLFGVHRDGSGLRQLISVEQSFVVGRSIARPPLAVNHRLLHVPDGNGTEVIVGQWIGRGAGRASEVIAKRLDVNTGRDTSVSLGAPPNARGWMFDARGEPVLVATRDAGRGAYHWRSTAKGDWKVLAEFDVHQVPWRPRFVDGAGQLYVTVVGNNPERTSELRRFDFGTGKPEPEAMVTVKGFDFAGEVVSETPGSQSLGVRVVSDAETTVWFDPRLQALQKMADARLPGHINRISCRRCLQDDITAVVYSYSDRDPGQFHIYTGRNRTWRKLGHSRPDIDPRLMATTDFERVRMRDGLEAPVWVTQPVGKAESPRPAVVLVHGGPWVRGRYWHWSAMAQFLASRGYAVIEPEFRGSTGYGQRLHRAGWRQWGQAMQDDVADALQ